jgi:hypothetical protein
MSNLNLGMGFLSFIEIMELFIEFFSIYSVWKKNKTKNEQEKANELKNKESEQELELIMRVSQLEDKNGQLTERVNELEKSRTRERT